MNSLAWFGAGFGSATILAIAAVIRIVAQHDEFLKDQND